MLCTKFAIVAGFMMVMTMVKLGYGQESKLHVTVLYESLCPDSVHFMRTQLGPSYESLKDQITVELVPFGKASSENNGAVFHCQHGPPECKGNRMQSCVLRQTSNQDAHVNFVVCQMIAQDSDSIKECAESVNLSSEIDACMNTAIGTQLQLDAERITKQYDHSFIPTIIYNNTFNKNLNKRSQHDFRGVVCELMQQTGISSVACV